MSTKDVGKIILSTQGEVKKFKEQLQAFAENKIEEDALNSNKDVKILYERLQMQIERFESNLDNKLDYLFKSIINDNDSTVQKLPIIETQNSQKPLKMNEPSKQHMILPSSKQRPPSLKQLPSHKSNSLRTDFISQPLTKLLYKKKKQDLTSKKISSIQNMKNNQNSENYGEFDKLLSTASYHNSGLISLINQGKISKDADLGRLMHQDNAFLINKPLIYHDRKEQFYKQTISMARELPYNAVLDTQNLKETPKEDNILKTNIENVAMFLPKIPKDKRVVEKNLELSIERREKSSLKNRFSEKIKDFEDLNFKKTNILTYPEVLDTYSLHQFMIRKGRTLEETPEFQSYKRICENIWDPIYSIIKSLERIFISCDIPLVYIDGKKLAKMAVESTRKSFTMHELLDCVVNNEEINKVLKIPSRMFIGPNGKNLAAIKIQTFWRMFSAMRDFKRIKVLIEKVKIIQTCFRVFLKYKQMKKTLKNKEQKDFEEYLGLSQQFKKEWKVIKLNKRIEIHINSYSFEDTKRLTMEKFLQRQNTQIARIFNLKDPMVEIIYVCPFDLPAEIINYYHKVLDLGEIHDYKERLHFVWPENHINFPSHFSTSKLLLFSPKAMKRIRNLIKNKPAFIVPGFPSNDDIKLAVNLQIPLMSSDPQKHFTFSSKSAAKRLFLNIDIPCPPGAYEIYDEKELINSLTILIANNLNINNWIFKIDDEFNGRGIAWFSVNSIGFFKELRKSADKIEISENLLSKIKGILEQMLPNRLKFATPSLYPNYKEYIFHFLRKGGLIEAMPNATISAINSPSLSFLIEPDGEIKFLTAYDKIYGKEFVNVAMSFPEKSLPEINLSSITQVIGQSLYEKGVFGYTTVDLISFPDPFSQKQGKNVLFWAIGLDCYLNHYTTGYFYFDFLMRGKMDSINGKYHLIAGNNERSFLYCPFLYHPGLSNIQYKTFFHMCRIDNISFDLERKIGSSFMLLDSLQSGVVGLLAVAENETETLRFMCEALKFLMQHSGNLNIKYFNNQEISRSDNLHILDIVSRMKLMYKRRMKVLQKIKKNLNTFNSQYL